MGYCARPRKLYVASFQKASNYSSPFTTTASTRTMMFKVSQMAERCPMTQTGAGDGLWSPSPNIVCFLLNMLCNLLKSTIPTGPDNPTDDSRGPNTKITWCWVVLVLVDLSLAVEHHNHPHWVFLVFFDLSPAAEHQNHLTLGGFGARRPIPRRWTPQSPTLGGLGFFNPSPAAEHQNHPMLCGFGVRRPISHRSSTYCRRTLGLF